MTPYVVAYLGAIVAANLLVTQFGPPVVIVNAFLFIGLDLTCRDRLHDAWSGRGLWPRMLALIAVGGLLSYIVNANAAVIAVASCVAFTLASLADAATYTVLRDREWFQRVNGSNIVGAAVDSLVFPAIAFGAFLPFIVAGQFIAKVAGGFLWSVILRRRFATPEAWEMEYQTAPDPEVDW